MGYHFYTHEEPYKTECIQNIHSSYVFAAIWAAKAPNTPSEWSCCCSLHVIPRSIQTSISITISGFLPYSWSHMSRSLHSILVVGAYFGTAQNIRVMSAGTAKSHADMSVWASVCVCVCGQVCVCVWASVCVCVCVCVSMCMHCCCCWWCLQLGSKSFSLSLLLVANGALSQCQNWLHQSHHQDIDFLFPLAANLGEKKNKFHWPMLLLIVPKVVCMKVESA